MEARLIILTIVLNNGTISKNFETKGTYIFDELKEMIIDTISLYNILTLGEEY